MLSTNTQTRIKMGRAILISICSVLTLSACSHSNSASSIAQKNHKECGTISVFANPPLAKEMFPVSVYNINGDNKNTGTRKFTLSPGKHTLAIMHHISEPLRFNSKLRGSLRNGKLIEIDVKPNMTYHIGAQFISNNRLKIRKQEFWEPTVWKVEKRKCHV